MDDDIASPIKDRKATAKELSERVDLMIRQGRKSMYDNEDEENKEFEKWNSTRHEIDPEGQLFGKDGEGDDFMERPEGEKEEESEDDEKEEHSTRCGDSSCSGCSGSYGVTKEQEKNDEGSEMRREARGREAKERTKPYNDSARERKRMSIGCSTEVGTAFEEEQKLLMINQLDVRPNMDTDPFFNFLSMVVSRYNFLASGDLDKNVACRSVQVLAKLKDENVKTREYMKELESQIRNLKLKSGAKGEEGGGKKTILERCKEVEKKQVLKTKTQWAVSVKPKERKEKLKAKDLHSWRDVVEKIIQQKAGDISVIASYPTFDGGIALNFSTEEKRDRANEILAEFFLQEKSKVKVAIEEVGEPTILIKGVHQEVTNDKLKEALRNEELNPHISSLSEEQKAIEIRRFRVRSGAVFTCSKELRSAIKAQGWQFRYGCGILADAEDHVGNFICPKCCEIGRAHV